MSDWSSYQEERFELYPPMLSGDASVYPVGSGLVPNPLSKEAYALLLKLFHLSDDIFHYPSITSIPFINDSEIWEELRSKVVDALVAGKLLDGSIIYTLTPNNPDVEIITLAEAKTRNLPRASSYTTESDDCIWIVLYISTSDVVGSISSSSGGTVNNTGILNWNWFFSYICCGTPPSTLPPGFNPPPTYTPPAPPSGEQRLTLDCTTNVIYHAVGTNHTGLLIDYGVSLGLGLLNLLPVADQRFDAVDIKSSFDAEISNVLTAHGIPNVEVKQVNFCYHYAGLGHILFQVAGFPATSLQSELWHLTIYRSDNTTEEIILEPNNRYGFPAIKLPIVVDGLSLPVTADIQVATAENNPTKIIRDYDLVTHIYLKAKVLPTFPSGAQALFSGEASSPDFELGLADLTYSGGCNILAPFTQSYPNTSPDNDAGCWIGRSNVVPGGLYSGVTHSLSRKCFQSGGAYKARSVTMTVVSRGATQIGVGLAVQGPGTNYNPGNDEHAQAGLSSGQSVTFTATAPDYASDWEYWEGYAYGVAGDIEITEVTWG